MEVKWISIDTPPKRDDRYWVYKFGYTMTMRFDVGRGQFYFTKTFLGFCPAYGITHWAEIPTPTNKPI